jgi:hypothetical protein
LQVVIVPVDAIGAVGLAGADLVWVVAAGGANLADFGTQAAICLHLEGQPALGEEIQATDCVAVKGDAESLNGVVGTLYYEASLVLLGLGSSGWVVEYAD